MCCICINHLHHMIFGGNFPTISYQLNSEMLLFDSVMENSILGTFYNQNCSNV